MFDYQMKVKTMEDYIENNLKPQYNVDGKKIDAEVKGNARIETTKLMTEYDDDGNMINQHQIDTQRKKRNAKRGWGRIYEMDFMAAIDLMIENSKLTYKVFRHLLQNSGISNHVKPMTQADIAEHFGKSRQSISPIMKFFRDYELICKVSDGLMINPFLCAKNGISDEELSRLQYQWEDEIGYYGQERLKDTLAKDIASIKASKVKSFSRLHK